MNEGLREQVWNRAAGRCEYCQMPQPLDRLRFEVEHVIPGKHAGPTTADNLSLACFFCNRYKGPNLSGIDPQTRQIVPLFNPRSDRWTDHFQWNDAVLLGKSPVGRATIDVLRINDPPRVSHRMLLIQARMFPLVNAE